MNNQEAIKLLNELKNTFFDVKYEDEQEIVIYANEIEALDLAIAALEWQQHPYSECKCGTELREWVEHDDEMECSDCGIKWNYYDNDTERFKYCPNCGANCQPKGE